SKLFEEIEASEYHTLFNYENCNFERLVIINDDESNFSGTPLSFRFCTIQKIDFVSINSINFDFYFHGCIIGNGSIHCSKIRNFTLNNCISKSLFLQDIVQVTVFYTEENIFIHKW